MLESNLYKSNAFVTLTYADNDQRTLEPKHLTDWLKRFRKATYPNLIRYYACGEYGDETFRPHYHAALFNYPTCRQEKTQYRNGLLRCCPECHLVSETWGRGNVMLGTLGTESAQYISGYVTKKMTKKDDPRLEPGMHPEFARMSLRPGIGADFVPEIASTMLEFNLEKRPDDVPSSLAHGKRKLPLGRYLKKRLRQHIGRDVLAPPSSFEEQFKEMQDVYARSIAAQKTGEEISPKKILIKDGNQKVLQMEAKQRIFKKGKTL